MNYFLGISVLQLSLDILKPFYSSLREVVVYLYLVRLFTSFINVLKLVI